MLFSTFSSLSFFFFPFYELFWLSCESCIDSTPWNKYFWVDIHRLTYDKRSFAKPIRVNCLSLGKVYSTHRVCHKNITISYGVCYDRCTWWILRDVYVINSVLHIIVINITNFMIKKTLYFFCSDWWSLCYKKNAQFAPFLKYVM